MVPFRLGLGPCAAPLLLAVVGTAASGPTQRTRTQDVAVEEGASLRVFERGTGPALVFLHAFSLDHREWDEEAAALAGSYRVVTYDLRAHGASSPALEPFSHLDELEAVLDALHIERATLIGLSSGAEIALDFTLAHPARVEGLVLASPGVSGWTPRRPMTWFEPIITAVRAGEVERAAELFADSPLMTCHAPAAARVRSMVLDNAKLWRSRGDLQRPLSPPAYGRLARVQVPVLLLSGAHDPSDAPAVAGELAAKLPHARRIEFPEAGHLLDCDEPLHFLSTIQGFLEQGPAVARASPARGQSKNPPTAP